MCKPGNRTIYRTCMEAALKISGRNHLPNKDVRLIIKAHGGCMAKVAKGKQPVLA